MSVEAVAGSHTVLGEVLPILHSWLLRNRTAAATRDCVIASFVRVCQCACVCVCVCVCVCRAVTMCV